MSIQTLLKNQSPLLLLMLVGLLLLSGCGDDDPEEAKKDPAKALMAQAIVVDSQFFYQIDVVRNQLNGAQQSLTPFRPTGTSAEDVLDGLVNHSTDRLWWSGIVDENGIVVNVYPNSYDDLFLNENRSDLAVVEHVLDSVSIDAGPLLFLEDGKRSIDYYRSILDNNVIVGAVFGGLALDTLINRAATFLEESDSTGYHLFVVDEEGRIVHDANPDLIGLRLTETDPSEDVALLATDLSTMTEGNGTYDFTTGAGAVDGAGSYYVGWKSRYYLENHYLVFVVTQAVNRN